MSLPSVGWSKCCEMGMIGGMKQSSFQSSVTMICFYFAEERALLSSSWYHRTLATRNFLLPSERGIETSRYTGSLRQVAVRTALSPNARGIILCHIKWRELYE